MEYNASIFALSEIVIFKLWFKPQNLNSSISKKTKQKNTDKIIIISKLKVKNKFKRPLKYQIICTNTNPIILPNIVWIVLNLYRILKNKKFKIKSNINIIIALKKLIELLL